MEKITEGRWKGYAYEYDEDVVNSFNLDERIPKDLKEIKEGDRIIFFRFGGVLSASTHNVFTFANWMTPKLQIEKCWYTPPHWLKEPIVYFQVKELHDMGNHEHSFDIFDVELFNPEKHKEFVLMDAGKLNDNKNEFIRKYSE